MADRHYCVSHTHVCVTGESGSDHIISDLLIYLETKKKKTFIHPPQSFITWVWLSKTHSEVDSLFFTYLFLWVFIFLLSPTYLSLSIASFSCFLYLLIFISLSLNSALYTLYFVFHLRSTPVSAILYSV